MSDGEAADILAANLDGEPTGLMQPLRFTAVHRNRMWENNIVAIGLSAGFIEPLEATSIYLIQAAITNLIKLFPQADVDPALASEYNRLMDVEYSRIRDFLILHYHLNSRDDSEMWRYCREMDVPDSLRARLELFEHCGFIEQYKDGLFMPANWVSVYLGQGAQASRHHPMADNLPVDAMVDQLDALRNRIAAAVCGMPTHEVSVEDYCEAPRPRIEAPARVAA